MEPTANAAEFRMNRRRPGEKDDGLGMSNRLKINKI
jgi:hypothetical protein